MSIVILYLISKFDLNIWNYHKNLNIFFLDTFELIYFICDSLFYVKKWELNISSTILLWFWIFKIKDSFKWKILRLKSKLALILWFLFWYSKKIACNFSICLRTSSYNKLFRSLTKKYKKAWKNYKLPYL